jgi:dihydroorotase
VPTIAIDGSVIAAMGRCPTVLAEREIDASGQWVLPGLVDLAVRLLRARSRA